MGKGCLGEEEEEEDKILGGIYGRKRRDKKSWEEEVKKKVNMAISGGNSGRRDTMRKRTSMKC